ncbi:unnamed protein product [Lampetra planeri]
MVTKGVVLHEFMHALGFHHEHCRSDRDDHILVLSHNAKPDDGDVRKIEAAALEFEKKMCVRFIPRSSQTDAIYIHAWDGFIADAAQKCSLLPHGRCGAGSGSVRGRLELSAAFASASRGSGQRKHHVVAHVGPRAKCRTTNLTSQLCVVAPNGVRGGLFVSDAEKLPLVPYEALTGLKWKDAIEKKTSQFHMTPYDDSSITH